MSLSKAAVLSTSARVMQYTIPDWPRKRSITWQIWPMPRSPAGNMVLQIRAVEIADQHFGVVQAELFDDVAANLLGGRGRVSVNGSVGEAVAKRPQAAELRPEVVAPGADAMGFVDREKADVLSLQEIERPRVRAARETYTTAAARPT